MPRNDIFRIARRPGSIVRAADRRARKPRIRTVACTVQRSLAATLTRTGRRVPTRWRLARRTASAHGVRSRASGPASGPPAPPDGGGSGSTHGVDAPSRTRETADVIDTV